MINEKYIFLWIGEESKDVKTIMGLTSKREDRVAIHVIEITLKVKLILRANKQTGFYIRQVHIEEIHS